MSSNICWIEISELKIEFQLHDQQEGRLPPADFSPSQIGKNAILKDENVFPSKKTLFLHHIF